MQNPRAKRRAPAPEQENNAGDQKEREQTAAAAGEPPRTPVPGAIGQRGWRNLRRDTIHTTIERLSGRVVNPLCQS
jgi:hypothetical protein